MLLDR